ncbi:MAG: undecaprenyl-diphosphate phosphatase [Terracidiphilus sp.]
MNAYFMAVLLGIVEGLTEFLPVSSTVHLRIAETLMKISPADPYWAMCAIVLQLGAVLAMCLLLLGRIADFIRTFPQGEGRDRSWLTHPLSLILIAFAFTAAPALLLHEWSEKNLGSPRAMALALLIGGAAMWAVDAWSERREPGTHDVQQMSLFQAVWIGLCQTISAVLPGTSRTMSTITAGQMAGLTRPAALEFSFLLSIPTMIAATIWDFWKQIHPERAALAAAALPAHVAMNPQRWGALFIGLIVSFVVALGVAEWFLVWVRRHGFAIFAVYRILLGGWLLFWGAKFIGG